MGILSDLLTGPIGDVGYGAMAESYERANKKADDQAALFRGLGVDLRAERMANEKDLNQKLSNFRSIELDFLSNAKKYNPEYEDYSEDQLKLIFAPMSEYLKGDTFVGKQEDVQKKVTEALFQSGGIKVDSPYTSVEEFTNQTKSAISKPLELYSGLAWNTWENQVGSLAYKTPEYNMDAMSTEGLRITAANFPQWFPATYGVDSPAMTVAKLSILSANAKEDAMVTNADGQKVLDPWKFAELKKERFKNIKDSINLTHAAELFGITENDFMKLIDSGSPSLARLTQVTTQLATMDINDPKRRGLIDESARLVNAHIEFLDNMREGLFEKYITKDSALTTEFSKMDFTMVNLQFPVGGEADKINKQHKSVRNNTQSNLGIYMPKDFQMDKIKENNGRVEEIFTFVAVPQSITERYGKQIKEDKKWIVISDSGVAFELPSINTIQALVNVDGDISQIRAPSKQAATIADFSMPNAELKNHAALAIKYAMEGKLQLNFVRRDNNTGAFIETLDVVRALEDAGRFGKHNRHGYNIKYFGTEPVEGYGTGIVLDTEIGIDTGI